MVTPNLSGRELARYFGISSTQVARFEHAGILSRDANGLFELQTVCRDLVQRLLLAERLCRRWCPDELEARFQDRLSLRRDT